MVDVFSPNHVELAAIFGILMLTSADRVAIQEMASKFLEAGIGSSGHGVVIVRAGEDGHFLNSATQPAKWLPPFYEAMNCGGQNTAASPKVVDPTGAGNAFLGGYAIGFPQTGSAVEAACYGTVASSFALEQIGIPSTKLVENRRGALERHERCFATARISIADPGRAGMPHRYPKQNWPDNYVDILRRRFRIGRYVMLSHNPFRSYIQNGSRG